MDDLISRQAALDALSGEIKIKGRTNTEVVVGYVKLVIDRLERLPSAEPRTGHWIIHDEEKNFFGGTCIECSECGDEYTVQYVTAEKFCRNCGADMRGEKEREESEEE